MQNDADYRKRNRRQYTTNAAEAQERNYGKQKQYFDDAQNRKHNIQSPGLL